MSRERAELSKKNPYHIPRYRYYELKYFCRQYDDWKKALTLIDGWQTSPNDISGIIKGCPPVSQTERIALSECSTPAASTSWTSALRNLIRHWHRTLKRA